jgi:pyridoxine 5-phosphate synthase
VSLFIAADPAQIEMAAKLKSPVIEIHTGAWCDAVTEKRASQIDTEWQKIVAGAKFANLQGLRFMPGTVLTM